MTSKHLKSGSGFGTKSLYERWKDTLDDDPYDDDECNAHNLSEEQMAFCDALIIKLRGQIKKWVMFVPDLRDKECSKVLLTDEVKDYVVDKYGTDWAYDQQKIDIKLEDLWQKANNVPEVMKGECIPLESIDIFWWTLDVSWSKPLEHEDIQCEDELRIFNENFNKQSKAGKRSFLRKLELQDVIGDGNCGFRSIAVALGLPQDQWPRIRSDLVSELDCNRQKYKEVVTVTLLKFRRPSRVTLGKLLPHARGLGFKPRHGGFPSGAKNECGLSSKAKVRLIESVHGEDAGFNQNGCKINGFVVR
uniref:OTU domain-containing protein n=1 Tax=Tanacetum cinerariifolium TaxID=118510 RepID=A0A699H8C0_TANCI|nr:hypothetical protein CTI12_AA572790 [Tanacetum cinerariifolium]